MVSQGCKTAQCWGSTLGLPWGEGSEGSAVCTDDHEALSKQAPWRAKAPLCHGSPLPLLFVCRVKGNSEGPMQTCYGYICISIICAFPTCFLLPSHKQKPSGNLFFNFFPLHFIYIRDPQLFSVKRQRSILGF